MTAARTGWLTWLVVEMVIGRDPWVIAAFDQREDADAFAASKVEPGSGVTYTVEPDPLFTRLQTMGGAS